MNRHVTFSIYLGKTVFTINTPDGAVHVIGCHCFDHLGEAYKVINGSQAAPVLEPPETEDKPEIAAGEVANVDPPVTKEISP